MEAPKKKKQAALLAVAALAILAFFILGGKKAPPPGPRPILRSVGEPDISPLGTINQGDSKTIAWQCQNTGDGDGLAALRVDRVSPDPTTGLLLSVNASVPAGLTVLLTLTGPYDLLPGDYVMHVAMLDATTAARPVIDSRNFPLAIGLPVPKAILTAGTLVVT